MNGVPGYRVIKATEALEAWLSGMAEAADEVIGKLPPWAVLEARHSSSPVNQAVYTMGAADAYRGALEAVHKGLRSWVHPDTGEIIGVDTVGDPIPPWGERPLPAL